MSARQCAAGIAVLACAWFSTMEGQTAGCAAMSADSTVRLVQRSDAFALSLRLVQRQYMDSAAFPSSWLSYVCSHMVRSVPRSSVRLEVVRVELATRIEALIATYAIAGDSVFLLNQVIGDSILDRRMNVAIWNRVFPPAMAGPPPHRDMSAAMEYACLVEELNANRASLDVSGGQCWGSVYSVERARPAGVSVLTETSRVDISDGWLILGIERR